MLRSSIISRPASLVAIIVASLALGAGAATAAPNAAGSDDFDVVPAPPATWQGSGAKIEEHLGAKLPLDAKFRTSEGKTVTLGDVIHGDVPTILTFNYTDCPMLCSLELNGLTAALPGVEPGSPQMRLGQQFRIVTIDLEPNELLPKLEGMKARYVARMAQLGVHGDLVGGWTFLAAETPGDDASIRRVADTVGFHYAYVPDRAEWAHPATIMLVSTTGEITRYLNGIEYSPGVMRQSIFKAGLGEPSSSVGFMFRCYHYDADANSYAHAGVVALRLAAGGAILALLVGLGVMHLIRKNGRPNDGAMS
jgi:protein SCO1/2|nr:SCO family protein [Kofleriaceae bacterium]